jgi:hypothetical protein
MQPEAAYDALTVGRRTVGDQLITANADMDARLLIRARWDPLRGRGDGVNGNE